MENTNRVTNIRDRESEPTNSWSG